MPPESEAYPLINEPKESRHFQPSMKKHHNFTPPKVTTSPKGGKDWVPVSFNYEIHIFPLQKPGQGRFNYILTKKMWIKCLEFNWCPVSSSSRGGCPFEIQLHTSGGAKM